MLKELPDLSKLSSSEKDMLIIALWEQNQLLRKQVAALELEVAALKSEIQELKARLSKNSQNSHKPPSSDGYQKPNPKSLREESGKLPGGQVGHKGETLQQTENPDHVVIHSVCACGRCGRFLGDILADMREKRQEIDIPPIKPVVTEHQAEIKTCPYCGFKNKADFPDSISQPVQYSSSVQSTAVYFNQNQLIPFERVQEIFWDCYSLHLSKGTLVNINTRCYDELEKPEEAIKQQLIASDVANFDESGMRVKAKLNWLHVSATKKLTHYAIHEHRGLPAMDEIGILPKFIGKAVHDHWKSYFNYENCEHGLCNAHHLRELKFVHEEYKQTWAKKTSLHLLTIKKVVDEAKSEGLKQLGQSKLDAFTKTYHEILTEGTEELLKLPQPTKTGKRGKIKQHKAKNLWDRLKGFDAETLRFMNDFSVPFDNNQGERDIRMVKVKQKVSGCFRSKKGAQVFCRIRGYISTAKKNGRRVLGALSDAITGNPFIPTTDPPS